MSLEFRFRSVLSRLRRALPASPLGIVLVGATFAAALTIGVMGAVVVNAWHGLPTLDTVRHIGDMDQATIVYDANDALVFSIARERRFEVPLSEISPKVVSAVLAIEDRKFLVHRGFDSVRIASAALFDIRRGRAVQGGSTITQQLARQSFLQPEKTVRRKVQELLLAGWLERMYTKEQILELYLNKVYFGDGLYGVEAASRGYFGKHASEVSVAEAALLAGLVKSPSSDAPTENLQRAIARRNIVLQAMLDVGSITRATWQTARQAPVQLHDGLRVYENHGDYFAEQVRRELIDLFGWPRVYRGGLRVFSTIDMPMQIAADASVADSLKALDARRLALTRGRVSIKPAAATTGAAEEEPLQAALVALDPVTGYIRAMVGGRSFTESHFNRAVQARRQPGSAFKPFVYASALEAGYTPATMIDHLDDPIATPEGAWTPEDEHADAASMSVRTALRTSSNRAAVQVLYHVGVDRVVERARQMGLGELPAVPSLALGPGEVTLQAMAAAYAAFANHGLVPRPTIIRRVEDQAGHVLYEAAQQNTPVMTDATAFLMSTMLADVVNAGTAARARQLGFTLPAGGKTGTTSNFNDAWFVGFTPTLVAGVWVGFDQPRTIFPNGFAADVAVPVWAKFMKAATEGDPPRWLTPPPDVTTAAICRLSGKLATDQCSRATAEDGDRRPMVYTEYFAGGTQPTVYCDQHEGPGLFASIGRLFGHSDRPSAPAVPAVAAPAGEAPQSVATIVDPASPTVVVPPDAGQAAAPKKKGGFWSRVFGSLKPDKNRQNR